MKSRLAEVQATCEVEELWERSFLGKGRGEIEGGGRRRRARELGRRERGKGSSRDTGEKGEDLACRIA